MTESVGLRWSGMTSVFSGIYKWAPVAHTTLLAEFEFSVFRLTTNTCTLVIVNSSTWPGMLRYCSALFFDYISISLPLSLQGISPFFSPSQSSTAFYGFLQYSVYYVMRMIFRGVCVVSTWKKIDCMLSLYGVIHRGLYIHVTIAGRKYNQNKNYINLTVISKICRYTELFDNYLII